MIGFTSTTLRQLSMEKIVELARASKAECVEWGGDIHVTDPTSAARAKQLCDDNEIEICSYGSYYRVGEKNTSAWENVADIAAKMGASAVRVWLGTRSSGSTDAKAYRRIVGDARRICDIAAALNLIVAPECHANTYNDRLESFLKIYADIDKPNFKTYFQSRYRDMEGDLCRLEKTVGCVQNVHLSFSEVSKMRLLRKKDDTCVMRIVDKLKQLDFKGNILLEYVKNSRPQNFERDLNCLRALYYGD